MSDSVYRRTLSVRDVLETIFRRRRIVLGCLAGSLLLAVLYLLVAKPVYEANAHVLIKMGRENVYVPEATSSADTVVVDPNREELGNSELKILQSRALAAHVVDVVGSDRLFPSGMSSWRIALAGSDHGNAENEQKLAVDRFQSRVIIKAVPKSNVLLVSYRSSDPETAATAVNALVKRYLEKRPEIYGHTQSAEFFAHQASDMRQRWEKSSQQLEAFKKNHNVSQLDEQRRMLLDQRGALAQALGDAVGQEAALTKRIDNIRQQLAGIPLMTASSREVSPQVNLIDALQARLAELESQERELLVEYGEKAPPVQKVRQLLDSVRKNLRAAQGNQHERQTVSLNSIHQALTTDLLKAQSDLKGIQAERQIKEDQLARRNLSIQKLDQDEFDFSLLRQAVDINRDKHAIYQSRLESARINQALDNQGMTSVSVIDWAQPPVKPLPPGPPLILLISLLAGAISGLTLAFLLDAISDTITDADDVQRYVGLPVLATISTFPSLPGSGRIDPRYWLTSEGQ